MALVQNELNANCLRGSVGSRAATSSKVAEKPSATVDADAQDDALWDRSFANSQDKLARIGERSLANRAAGRTKKINL